MVHFSLSDLSSLHPMRGSGLLEFFFNQFDFLFHLSHFLPRDFYFFLHFRYKDIRIFRLGEESHIVFESGDVALHFPEFLDQTVPFHLQRSVSFSGTLDIAHFLSEFIEILLAFQGTYIGKMSIHRLVIFLLDFILFFKRHESYFIPPGLERPHRFYILLFGFAQAVTGDLFDQRLFGRQVFFEFFSIVS